MKLLRDSVTGGGSIPPLPKDVVSCALTFIDVRDVPNAAVVSKQWLASLRLVENELWLSLVRKHHPILEQTVRLLYGEEIGKGRSDIRAPHEGTLSTLPVPEAAIARGIAAPSRQDNDSSAPGPTQNIQGIPPPSRLWKDQFRRRSTFVRSPVFSSPRPSLPSPRPLSSYLALLDLTCYRGGIEVGRVSRIVENMQFQSDKLVLHLRDLKDEFSSMNATDAAITVHLIEKNTGKQAILYRGSMEDREDEHFAWYGPYDPNLIEVFDRNRFYCGGLDFITDATLNKSGACICTCEDTNFDEFSFFRHPEENECDGKCCSCISQWNCFYQYSIEIAMRRDFCANPVDETVFLRILENVLLFY